MPVAVYVKSGFAYRWGSLFLDFDVQFSTYIL